MQWRHAFPLLEPLLVDGLAMPDAIKAYQEHDERIDDEVSFCGAYRSTLVHALAARPVWQSPTLIATLRQAFKDLWAIQHTFHPYPFEVHSYDALAYLLGMHGDFDALTGLELPPAHQQTAMVAMVLGHLRVRPERGDSLLGLVIGDTVLQEEVARVLEQRFGLTTEEQMACIHNLYDNEHARHEYPRMELEQEEDISEEEIEALYPEDRVPHLAPQLVGVCTGHIARLHSLCWSPDAKRLVSGSEDSTARVWQASTGKELAVFREHHASVNVVAWSPTGEQIASGGNDGLIYVWHPLTGKQVCACIGHTGWVCALAWSPDGKRLASASFDRTIRIWDVSSGTLLMTLTGHAGVVTSVAWSPDGTRLASGGGYPEAGDDLECDHRSTRARV
jgi:hypothetical protein